MKKILGFVFLFTSFISGASAAQLIAFERNDAVWIASLDGTAEKKIVDGIFPAISPDGNQVAFVWNDGRLRFPAIATG